MAIDAGFTQEDDDIFVCGIEHIQKLLEIEREACANVCEELANDAYNNEDLIYEQAAKAIRARGKE